MAEAERREAHGGCAKRMTFPSPGVNAGPNTAAAESPVNGATRKPACERLDKTLGFRILDSVHRLIRNPPPLWSASTSAGVIQAKSPGIECLMALAATP